MKFLSIALILFGVALFAAEEKAPPPPFPSQIILTSGAVIRNTSPMRWQADGVAVKHAGGADLIKFANMQPASRAAVMAAKPDAPASSVTTAAVATKRALTGQVFVTTQGAGSYKFSGALVAAYPMTAYNDIFRAVQVGLLKNATAKDEAKAWSTELAKRQPLGSATTNADGKYSMELTSNEPVFLFCFAARLAGRVAEENLWIVPVGADAKTADLNGSNCKTYEADVAFVRRR